MKKTLATGIMAGVISISGCGNTEICTDGNNASDTNRLAIDAIEKIIGDKVIKLCGSMNGVKEGNFVIITQDDTHILVSKVSEKALRIVNARKGIVSTVTKNEDGTFTIDSKELINKKESM